MVREEDWLREGMSVESRTNQDGYRGAWFRVKILQLYYKKSGVCHEVRIEYRDFAESDEPESKALQETVKKQNLRPSPPSLPDKQWKERDAVETWYKKVWWIGFIKHYNTKKDTYLVYYGSGQEDKEIKASYIRTRQNYIHSGWHIHVPMQKPADWEITKEKQVAKTQPRAEKSTRSKQFESDDSSSWDEQKEHKQQRKKSIENKRKKPKLQEPTSRTTQRFV